MIRVATFAPEEHDFNMVLVDRAVRQGLLAPDELAIAARVWERLTRAQAVEPVAPAAPTTLSEEVPHE